MAYTKTNLNETTETVAVDMTAEDIENNEATETVAEQNARGYSKTVWNESTPITADKLNKMETGIANGIDKTAQIMEIPITNADGWQQFRWTRPNYNPVSWTRDAKQGKAIEIFNEGWGKPLLIVKDGGGLDVLRDLTVNGGSDFGHTDLFLKHDGKLRGLMRGVSGGGLQIHSYNENGEWLNYMEMASGLIALGANTKVGGNLTTDGNLNSQGNLVFSNLGIGGGLNANIQNAALHAHTGNGQMLTVDEAKRIYVGNPQTPLSIESSVNPNVKVGGNVYQLFHTGNFNPNTKLDAGNFSIFNRDLKIYNKRALVGHNTGEGNHLVINYDRDFANGVAIQGLTRIESIETGGKLAFSNIGSGGGLNANIHNLALHSATGNGQMMTIGDDYKIYLGNPNTSLVIESHTNPVINVNRSLYQLYHTGNKPTAGDIGALPLSGGIMNGTLSMEYGGHTRRRIASIAGHGGTDLGDNNSKTTIQSNTVPTWWNGSQNRAMLVFDRQDPSDYIVRCGAGLGGAAGYITFTW